MGFKDQYTTAELVAKEGAVNVEPKDDSVVLEKDKIVISNDAYVIADLLERMLNRMVK